MSERRISVANRFHQATSRMSQLGHRTRLTSRNLDEPVNNRPFTRLLGSTSCGNRPVRRAIFSIIYGRRTFRRIFTLPFLRSVSCGFFFGA